MITSCLLHHVIVNCMLCGQNYIICITFLLTYSPCIHTLVRGHTDTHMDTQRHGDTLMCIHMQTQTQRDTRSHTSHTHAYSHTYTHIILKYTTPHALHTTHTHYTTLHALPTIHTCTCTHTRTHARTHTHTHTHTHTTHTIHMHTRAHTIHNTV